jgi:hypothetical protein
MSACQSRGPFNLRYRICIILIHYIKYTISVILTHDRFNLVRNIRFVFRLFPGIENDQEIQVAFLLFFFCLSSTSMLLFCAFMTLRAMTLFKSSPFYVSPPFSERQIRKSIFQ